MKNGGSKKKLTSPLGGVVLLLSIASIFSIGFSSWNIGNPSASANIDIKADDINQGYFIFNRSENSDTNPPVSFNYNSYGVVKDGIVTSKGSFAFFMAVLLRGNDGIYKNNETLESFSFSYEVSVSAPPEETCAPLIQYLSSVTYTINGSSTSSPFSASVSKDTSNESLANIGITCTDPRYLSEERLFFRVSLNFDFPKAENFKKTIADNMPNTSLNFKVIFGDES